MAKDLNNKTEKTLRKELAAKRKNLFEFRFGLGGSGTKNVKTGRDAKKDIARILTELNNR